MIYLFLSPKNREFAFKARVRKEKVSLPFPFPLLSNKYSSLQVATVISAAANWDFAGIRKIGWGWTAIIWVYNIMSYLLLDPLKFAVRYFLSGRAWGLLVDQRVSQTTLPETVWLLFFKTIGCPALFVLKKTDNLRNIKFKELRIISKKH